MQKISNAEKHIHHKLKLKSIFCQFRERSDNQLNYTIKLPREITEGECLIPNLLICLVITVTCHNTDPSDGSPMVNKRERVPLESLGYHFIDMTYIR